jgi:hypothetical protein
MRPPGATTGAPVSKMATKHEQIGIFGVMTGLTNLNDWAAAELAEHPGLGPLSIAVGSDGVPLSICGTQVDIAKNMNKAYACQVIVNSSGEMVFYGLYGRIGAKPQRAPQNFTAMFQWSTVVLAKFGGRGSDVGQFLGSTPVVSRSAKLYKVMRYDTASATPTVTPSIATVNTPPADESILEPRVAALLSRILSATHIRNSVRQTMNVLGVTGIGDATPAASSVAAAKAAHAEGMKIWADIDAGPPYIDRSAGTAYNPFEILPRIFETMLREVPLQVAVKPGADARLAVRDRANWARIGDALDLYEQASLSLVAAAAVPRPEATTPTEPARGDPKPHMHPGIFSGAVDPKRDRNGALTGVFLRPTRPTRGPKETVARLSGDPLAARYAALGCDVVPGNDFDRAICTHFVERSRDAKSFDCFAIYPETNDAKAPQFEGARSLLLLHGTSMSSVAAILGSEINTKYCSRGRLGPNRIYMADDMKKSEQYAHPDVDRATGKTCRYFFVAQCRVPDTIVTTVKDLHSGVADSEALLHADGSLSLGSLGDPPQSVPLVSVVGRYMDEKRGFFGDRVGSVMLPGKALLHPEGTHTSSFDYAEYTFGQNGDVVLRYLIVAYY